MTSADKVRDGRERRLAEVRRLRASGADSPAARAAAAFRELGRLFDVAVADELALPLASRPGYRDEWRP